MTYHYVKWIAEFSFLFPAPARRHGFTGRRGTLLGFIVYVKCPDIRLVVRISSRRRDEPSADEPIPPSAIVRNECG